jgi:hypothetical protein
MRNEEGSVCELEYAAAVPVERDRECPDEKGERLRWLLKGRPEWWKVAVAAAMSEVEGSVQRRILEGRVVLGCDEGGERKRCEAGGVLIETGERSEVPSSDERGEDVGRLVSAMISCGGEGRV